ncbi:DUF1697 domain-containing protein [Sphingomonas koreensis]|uniref:DUF1697 domain-containing protein n=1 Tax=Sphingomonas koreensis TaxID=93064 RepID=A0A430G5B2_9SPHN|nr:DUF1697 domain-containing protein [Sphingomonas koreensis]RSY87425.1 DUF1697 domain-containing protein [Sphingomonas koreensis]
MASHIALLHSITIGSGRRLAMADWREMMESIGLRNPRTLIATGNALFESEGATIGQLEERLETAFAQRFGRQIDTIVLSAAQWRDLVSANPFAEEVDGTRIAIRVMRNPLDETALAALAPYATQGERMKLANGHLWLHFPQDPTRSRLGTRLTTRRFGAGTVRNWNTVRRLNEMIAGP